MASNSTSELRSPTSMSLGRVVDSMDSHTSRSDTRADSISDGGSPSDTITAGVQIMTTNKKTGGHSRRTSTVTEQQNMYATEAEEISMGRQEYERENSLEQQGVKRRRVEDQMSSLVCRSSRFMLLISFSSSFGASFCILEADKILFTYVFRVSERKLM